MYSNYLSGRSEKLFKFPLEFMPERWLNEDMGKIHPFSVVPFGVGTRMCIGTSFLYGLHNITICMLGRRLNKGGFKFARNGLDICVLQQQC